MIYLHLMKTFNLSYEATDGTNKNGSTLKDAISNTGILDFKAINYFTEEECTITIGVATFNQEAWIEFYDNEDPGVWG